MTTGRKDGLERDERWLDHLVRERRSSLDQAEHEQLDRAVASSVGLRAALLAHQEFEERGAVQAGDDERCQHIARGAETELGWRERPSSSSQGRVRRMLRWAVPLGFFAAGAAAAATALEPMLTNHEAEQPQLQPNMAFVDHPAQPQAMATEQPEKESTDEEPGVRVEGPVFDPQDLPKSNDSTSANSKPTAPVAPAASASLTAKELFTLASEHKSGGEWQRASELYRELLSSYPGSDYAAVAQMALGKRALATGQAQAALKHFRNYQKRSRRSMTAEAMWGEAQALAVLGRTAESERVRRELARRYPKSPYAEQD